MRCALSLDFVVIRWRLLFESHLQASFSFAGIAFPSRIALAFRVMMRLRIFLMMIMRQLFPVVRGLLCADPCERSR